MGVPCPAPLQSLETGRPNHVREHRATLYLDFNVQYLKHMENQSVNPVNPASKDEGARGSGVRLRDMSRRNSPAYRQRIAQLLTGYGAIWLRREGDYAVVLLQEPNKSEWIEVIREFLDGNFSHIIEPLGIEAEFDRDAK